MKRLTRADLVVAIVGDSYLRSADSMFEIFKIWERCQAEDEQMARRVVPVLLPDVKIGDVEERGEYVAFWSAKAKKWESLVHRNDLEFSKGSWDEARLAKGFAHHVDAILYFLNDVLMPRSLDAYFDDDFAAIRDALRRLIEEGEPS